MALEKPWLTFTFMLRLRPVFQFQCTWTFIQVNCLVTCGMISSQNIKDIHDIMKVDLPVPLRRAYAQDAVPHHQYLNLPHQQHPEMDSSAGVTT